MKKTGIFYAAAIVSILVAYSSMGYTIYSLEPKNDDGRGWLAIIVLVSNTAAVTYLVLR